MSKRSSHRFSAMAKLALAAAFLAVLAIVAICLTRSLSDQSPVVIPPDVLAQARQTSATPLTPSDHTFTGQVTDAITHQPISAFTVEIGSISGRGSSPRFWIPARQFQSGRYNVMPTDVDEKAVSYLRIEAHGYKSALSPPMARGQEHDFALQPAKDLEGRVFNPDGKLAKGATVVLALPGEAVWFENLQFDAMNKQIAGPDGHYDFPPQTGEYILAAANSKGFAQADQTLLARSTDLHLQPYAHVQGRLVAGRDPIANQLVSASPSGLDNLDWARPFVFPDFHVQTDSNGNFAANLPSGTFDIYRPMIFDYLTVLSQPHAAVLASGQTVSIQIGGNGRSVTGHVKGGNKYAGSGAPHYCIASGWSVPTLPQMPDNVKHGPDSIRQIWINLFQLTPAGKEYLAGHPQANIIPTRYAAEIDRHGDYRIDDVVPGDYRIWAYFRDNNRRLSAMGQTTFTMPPITPELADQPLNIPDIIATNTR